MQAASLWIPVPPALSTRPERTPVLCLQSTSWHSYSRGPPLVCSVVATSRAGCRGAHRPDTGAASNPSLPRVGTHSATHHGPTASARLPILTSRKASQAPFHARNVRRDRDRRAFASDLKNVARSREQTWLHAVRRACRTPPTGVISASTSSTLTRMIRFPKR